MGDSKSDGLDELSIQQRQAIVALMQYPTILAAAQACGVTARTIRRWRQEDHFDWAYRQARGALLHHAVAKLYEASAEAAVVLRKDLASADAAIRVRAAQAILSQAFRGREIRL